MTGMKRRKTLFLYYKSNKLLIEKNTELNGDAMFAELSLTRKQ